MFNLHKQHFLRQVRAEHLAANKAKVNKRKIAEKWARHFLLYKHIKQTEQ